jgi:hypothetical protein
MAITSNFANVASVTRASKAWLDGWSNISGATVGTLAEFASGVARIGSDGLLIEPATTNQVRNPRFEGGTVGTIGSGGAWPTNMSLLSAGGMTWTINAFGTENGWPYMDITLTGTASGDAAVAFEAATQVTAANGEDWTATLGIKLTGGTMPGNPGQAIYEATSGGSFVTVTTRLCSADTAVDTNHRRYTYSHELAGGGTARAYPAFYISAPTGAVFASFRLYAPQFENKDYSTSVVLPTAASPAASTRAADVVNVPATGSWYNNSTRTIYAEFTPRALTGTGFYFSLQNDSNTYAAALNSSGTLVVQEYQSLGTQIFSGSMGALAAGTQRKVVYAYADNDMATSANGATQVTDTSGIQDATHVDLYLGSFSGSLNFAPMYMSDFRFWPRRLSNAELEALVGN